ncbi:MAG: serine/threonine-protein kinase [Myxococcota bacterium]
MSEMLLEPGDTIRRLVIRATIGRGAVSTVYKAYDPARGQDIALKLMHNHVRDDAVQARRRLLERLQAMTSLSHPNVVTIYDVGTLERSGGPLVFVEMEYVHGEPLDAWIEKRHQDPRWSTDERGWRAILDALVQAGEGLAAAHARGLVHRDFRSASVLVDEDERAKVIDFGQVYAGDEDPPPIPATIPWLDKTTLGTTTWTIPNMTSPRSMAPELFAGFDGDARTDQFEFCSTLYHALYGRFPFPGNNLAQVAHAMIYDHPLEPPPKAPRIPRSIHRAVSRGLHKDPHQRHPSMLALLDALRVDRDRDQPRPR